jgi:predicted GIY-YIG superfamily endonuclease
MTTLYRAFDRLDRLIYVGISEDVFTRMGQHQSSGWSSYATRITFETFSTREEAAIQELKAIREEDPVFNRAGRSYDRFFKWMAAYPDQHADDISDEQLDEMCGVANALMDKTPAYQSAAKEARMLNLGDL